MHKLNESFPIATWKKKSKTKGHKNDLVKRRGLLTMYRIEKLFIVKI